MILFFWITAAVIIFGVSAFFAVRSMQFIATEEAAFAEDVLPMPRQTHPAVPSETQMASTEKTTVDQSTTAPTTVQTSTEVETNTATSKAETATIDQINYSTQSSQESLQTSQAQPQSVAEALEKLRQLQQQSVANGEVVSVSGESPVNGGTSSPSETTQPKLAETSLPQLQNLGKYIGSIAIDRGQFA